MEIKAGQDMVCEAHSMIQEELTRVKNDIGEIYALDRERSQTMAQIQSDLTEVKTKQLSMEKDITELKTDMSQVKGKVTKMATQLDNLEENQKVTNENIKTLIENMDQKKWQPKDYCVIVVAFFSFLGALATAFFSYLK